ncbi:MAG: hypothetical protein QM493_02970 [Sulfurovum sp.]
MIKSFILSILLLSGSYSKDSYERNCIPCHAELPTSLQKMFMRYLLIYGSEKNMKIGIKHYIKHPSKDISMMFDLFIESYGIKKRTSLSNRELDEAIDVYWEKFKIFGRLR